MIGRAILGKRHLVWIALLFGSLAGGVTLWWYFNQPDTLHATDQVLLRGSTHAALRAYQQANALRPQQPALLARIGLIQTLRDDPAAAQAALASSLAHDPDDGIYDLVRLTQGVLAAKHAGYGDASAFWQLMHTKSPLACQRNAHIAEQFLKQGRYAEAETTYRTALLQAPSAACLAYVHTSLAILRASSDPATAQAELAQATQQPTADHASLIQALADLLLPQRTGIPAQLGSILTTRAPARQQLLGQFYLDLGLYSLAESQFRQVPADGQIGLAAATYLAYGRWLSGDQRGGVAQLQQIVAEHPDEPRARALLALVALGNADPVAAREQLNIIQATAPNAAATHLAWGQWYAAQRDYLAAAAAYRRALDRAPPDERETYALYVARFSLDSALEVCSSGLSAAEIATSGTNARSAAFSALAQARLACNDPEGSRAAAEQAIQRDPTDPEAHYRLAQALVQLGNQDAAQQALITAADYDLGGPWQQRAENQMRMLGLSWE